MNSPTAGDPLKTTQTSVFSVRVIEARLTVSVAKFGRMNLTVELKYGGQVFRTNEAAGSDVNPMWDEMQLFEVSEAPAVLLRVLHKAMLIGDVELGHCTISLSDLSRRRNNDWWALSNGKSTVGSVKLSFCFDEDMKAERSPSPPHVARSALGFTDLKEELMKKMNELELEKEELEYYKLKYKRKMEQLNQEKRKYRAKIQAVDVKLSSKPDKSADENDGKMLLSPTSRFDMSISEDLGRRQKSLNLRENSLMAERKRIQEERVELEKEKEQLMQLKDQISQEYAKLKREKHKLMVQRKVAGLRRSDQNQATPMRESLSEENLRKTRPGEVDLESEWREIEQIRLTLNQKQQLLEKNLRLLQEEQDRFRTEQEEFEKVRQQTQGKERLGSNEPVRRSGRTPQRMEKIPKSPFSKPTGDQRAMGRLLVFN